QRDLVRAVQKGVQERAGALTDGERGWMAGVADGLLASKGAGRVLAGIELVGQLRLEGQQAKLVTMAEAGPTPEKLRLSALVALATIDARKHAGTLGKALGDAGRAIETRERCAT